MHHRSHQGHVTWPLTWWRVLRCCLLGTAPDCGCVPWPCPACCGAEKAGRSMTVREADTAPCRPASAALDSVRRHGGTSLAEVLRQYRLSAAQSCPTPTADQALLHSSIITEIMKHHEHGHHSKTFWLGQLPRVP
jgi:hypothetical protein